MYKNPSKREKVLGLGNARALKLKLRFWTFIDPKMNIGEPSEYFPNGRLYIPCRYTVMKKIIWIFAKLCKPNVKRILYTSMGIVQMDAKLKKTQKSVFNDASLNINEGSFNFQKVFRSPRQTQISSQMFYQEDKLLTGHIWIFNNFLPCQIYSVV